MPFVAIDHTIAFAIDAVLKASDMQKIDQNIDDHEARIATGEAGGFPVGDNSVTPAKLSAQAAGVYLMSSNDAEVTSTSASYVKLKETIIAKSGTYRIKFNLRETSGGYPTYGQIYRNGVAVGTERYSSGDVTFSEDISGWSAGDLVQVYGKCGAFAEVGIKYLRLYGAAPGDFGTNPSY